MIRATTALSTIGYRRRRRQVLEGGGEIFNSSGYVNLFVSEGESIGYIVSREQQKGTNGEEPVSRLLDGYY